MVTNSSPNAQLVNSIRDAVHAAAAGNQKIAMFHFQILKNAETLDTVSPEAFCAAVGVPDTYKTEFRKMLSLAKVIRQQGLRFSEA